MAIDNDTRGWIMAGISGVACVVGASIICVDTIVRLFPRMHHFSIAESDAFLSASLSLSFGVMLYSALYSMLPQSKRYLEDAGYSPRAASYLLIALFLGGVVGIRLLSRLLHRFIPSHVVDCDHTHDEGEAKDPDEEMAEHQHQHHTARPNGSVSVRMTDAEHAVPDEDTPLLSRTNSNTPATPQRMASAPDGAVSRQSQDGSFVTAPTSRKPSFFPRALSRTFTRYVSTRKEACDETGPCMGYSEPCGQDCFKAVQRRMPASASGNLQRQQTWPKAPTNFQFATPGSMVEQSAEEGSHSQHGGSPSDRQCHDHARMPPRSRSTTHHLHHTEGERHGRSKSSRRSSVLSHPQSIETDHHHHVPTNAFMSIGLQTSLAIALHKLPEGFITYATNHANPSLGFSVFMALFIHNITEGFAMSLPLYLALNSRLKAIIWSAFLGGVSQPLGAGLAALWFRLAANGRMAPDEGVYGGMFAVTSGVMTSVALSLYSESLQMSHNKGTCIAFAFLGMGVLGISYALTAT